MTTLDDLQVTAKALWDRFPNATTERYALAVAEEAGEVCRAVLKRAVGIRGTYEQWTTEIEKEVCDTLATLLMIAITEGFSLQDVFEGHLQGLISRPMNHDPVGPS